VQDVLNPPAAAVAAGEPTQCCHGWCRPACSQRLGCVMHVVPHQRACHSMTLTVLPDERIAVARKESALHFNLVPRPSPKSFRGAGRSMLPCIGRLYEAWQWAIPSMRNSIATCRSERYGKAMHGRSALHSLPKQKLQHITLNCHWLWLQGVPAADNKVCMASGRLLPPVISSQDSCIQIVVLGLVSNGL